MAVREKKIYSGKILEIEIYNITKLERSKSRKKKLKESLNKQKNINNKNARKQLTRLANTNFTDKDLAVHLTYDNKNLPQSEEEAKKDVVNYIRRLNHYRKKRGIPPVKYIAVIEFKEQQEGKDIRMHHHMFMDGLVDRDTVENIWAKGRANADRLKSDEFGYEGLSRYISKDPKGKKRWMQSRGLIQPTIRINDNKYSNKKMWTLSKCQGDKEELQKLYPGYIVTDFYVEINKYIGTQILMKMRKLE